MYALKRVSIENADENTVKGFKGEIDLLKKLSGVERVIQLIDCEMNEEKKMLSVVSIGDLYIMRSTTTTQMLTWLFTGHGDGRAGL
jgi:hypothetical protein